MNVPYYESVPELDSVNVLAKEDCVTASYNPTRKKEFQPLYMSGIKSYDKPLHELSVTETINKSEEEDIKTDAYYSAAENVSWLNIESELRFKKSAKICRSNSLSSLRSKKEDNKVRNDWFYKLKIQCGKYDVHLILNQTIQTQYTSLAENVNQKDHLSSLFEKLKCSKPFTSAFERMYQLTICTSWITSEKNLCEQNELLYRFILAKNWCSLKEVLNLLQQAMEYQMHKLSKAFSWYLLRRIIKQSSISDCLSQVYDIWPGFFCRCSKITKGHAAICSKEVVIVIDSDEYLEGLPGELYGIPVKQSAYYITTDYMEDEKRKFTEDNLFPSFDQAVSGEHAQELFLRHTKLTLIFISITEPWSVQLGCQAKGIIPMGEEHLPAVVCSRNTKVVHGKVSFMHKYKMHVGSKIGPATKTSWGTLGGFVRRRGRDAFLTCSHVIYDKETLLCGNQRDKNEDEVAVQCYFNNDKNTFICGHVIDDVFDYNKCDKTSIDAAVVLIDSEKYLIDKDEIVQIIDSDLSTSSKPVAFLGMTSPYVNYNYKIHEIKKGAMKARLVGAKSGYVERDVPYEDYDAIKETFKDKRNKHGVIAQWTDLEEQFAKVKAMYPKPLLVASDVHLQTKLIPKLGEEEEQNPRFVRFYHQLLMENFPFEKGDSGTCIYIVEDKSHTKASNEENSTGCIGMAIASYRDIRDDTEKTIVTPMEAILEALRII